MHKSLKNLGPRRVHKLMSEALKILQEQCRGAANASRQSSKEDFKRITDYESFITARAKRRKPSALREITKTISQMPPHTIKFAVGVPNVNTFPFQEVSVRLKDGSSYNIDGEDLEAALQYMPSSGHTKLVRQLQELQDKAHGPQDWSNTGLVVTCGGSEPMASAFDLLLDEGDPIIIPIPVYPGSADALRAYKPEYIAMQQDKDGIQPTLLRQILQERKQKNKKMPKLMYINPTGCNPTGRNLLLERRKEIYQIACEYNIIILEDDPYYQLHFLDENIPSLLSMDVEGRVIRLDSFSKILSSGLRVGYVTGPSSLIRQIELHLQVSTLHTSALSQMVVSKLLDHWGYDQYLKHIQNVRAFYRERRDLMLAACDKYLTGLAKWNASSGGMFLWLQVPLLEDTWNLAAKHCLEKCLLIVPGHPFTGEVPPATYNFIRLSFSLASPAQMDEGVKLLAEIIKEQATKKC
ncbi:kynurenine/alpha-aminoadipate aminotransferase, mitochondrial-like isoform X2 [Macrosteles quadrilineatus]|uniref:kynurenine/alpha-aminoadipate aminotransferase, mitochondrial-like isoform X2 n=1 Tax=Macrosteles quadrilineatus TaxID=74068 RepID=UPI0023E2E94C|nr:kynurenine/alpha-aminoadipate aminotransferase, mitochondrial-like isoform X2 [Macrosteles quadrilineatus]